MLVRLEMYNPAGTVVADTDVYVGQRLQGLWHRASRAELRQYFLDLIQELDSL